MIKIDFKRWAGDRLSNWMFFGWEFVDPFNHRSGQPWGLPKAWYRTCEGWARHCPIWYIGND